MLFNYHTLVCRQEQNRLLWLPTTKIIHTSYHSKLQTFLSSLFKINLVMWLRDKLNKQYKRQLGNLKRTRNERSQFSLLRVGAQTPGYSWEHGCHEDRRKQKLSLQFSHFVSIFERTVSAISFEEEHCCPEYYRYPSHAGTEYNNATFVMLLLYTSTYTFY